MGLYVWIGPIGREAVEELNLLDFKVKRFFATENLGEKEHAEGFLRAVVHGLDNGRV